MGIITKEVEIRPTGKMVQYYKDKGYDARYNKPLIVKIEDLQSNSHVVVDVVCDYCNEEILTMTRNSYTQRTRKIDKIACKKCCTQKAKEVFLLKYGVDNYAKTKECREKMKDTIKNLYGVEHYSQTDEYKEKFHNTCTDRYGESYRRQFADKSFETFRNKTGYNFPSQSPDVRTKIIKSCVEHYGVDSPAKSPEVRKKMSQTLYANSSQKASRQQCYISNLYQGILNFPVKHYNVDIYLLEDNLVIEYDGGFHLGNVITGRETIKEFNRKEIIRNNIIKEEGYKLVRISSSDDKLPQDSILLEMLNQARQYFSDYPQHSWIEFNIDTSTIRNAENPNGSPYDFGILRTIKDSNLNATQTI